MEQKKNQLANPGGTDIRNLQQFQTICEAEFTVRHYALIAEFKGRKQQLLDIKERKLKEYEFIFGIINLNTQMNEGKLNPTAAMQIEKQLSEITFEQAMQSQTISYWQKEFGDGFIIPTICDLLNYFLRQFTVKEMLDGNGIMMLASKLIVSQPHLRIKELVMCLNKALKGDFGPTYQRIGMDTIMQWLTKFYEGTSTDLECRNVNNKPDESRGEQPWLEVEKKLERYREEQESKKNISEKIWGIEKRKREVEEHKEKVLADGSND